ncbi:MAG TPA: FecR domain-containing protein, partial [Spirochaetota bacterium]|nr:FecR domain-containing protein [Spirochaetota bacterium]
MKRIIIVVLLIVISVVAGFAWYLVKSEKMIYRAPALVHEKAIVTFVVGDVTVKKNGAEEWQHVIVGQSVEPGDELQTGTSALADIRFHSSMAVRITENSHLVMDANSIKKMELNLQSGSLYGKFHKLYDEHALVIKTVTSIAAVRGTD